MPEILLIIYQDKNDKWWWYVIRDTGVQTEPRGPFEGMMSASVNAETYMKRTDLKVQAAKARITRKVS